jgi:predicted ArsR family transcriptional regulator
VEIKKTGMERVAQSLLTEGPASARGLASRLGVTPAAIRRHLDSLTEAGWVIFSDRPAYGPAAPSGRGRPARVFSLTARGRTQFAHNYDHLAVEALNSLYQVGGKQAIDSFAEGQAARLVGRISSAASYQKSAGVDERARVAVEVLNEEGYAATVEVAHGPVGGLQLCQHNCPIENAASAHPEICEHETRALGEVLGVHVTRIATIAAGDGVCTTMIPTQESVVSRSKEKAL